MLFPESQVRIWLYTQPADMRKSYNGLSALVKQKLQEDPLSGQLFVFINRKRTQMKVLYFDRTGYCIWGKRLEQGQFHFNGKSGVKQLLSWTNLKLIVEGIDTTSIRQFKRYKHR
ncbi:MAG: IS66 family insertion sequence element accessory protein TnpB [Thiohalomonadaceae bacterium]